MLEERGDLIRRHPQRRVLGRQVAVFGGGGDRGDEAGEEGHAGDPQDGDGEEDLNQSVSRFRCAAASVFGCPGSEETEPAHRSTARKRASRPEPSIATVTDCAAVEP